MTQITFGVLVRAEPFFLAISLLPLDTRRPLEPDVRAAAIGDWYEVALEPMAVLIATNQVVRPSTPRFRKSPATPPPFRPGDAPGQHVAPPLPHRGPITLPV